MSHLVVNLLPSHGRYVRRSSVPISRCYAPIRRSETRRRREARKHRSGRVMVPQIPRHVRLKTSRTVTLRHRNIEAVVICVERVRPKHLHDTGTLLQHNSELCRLFWYMFDRFFDSGLPRAILTKQASKAE